MFDLEAFQEVNSYLRNHDTPDTEREWAADEIARLRSALTVAQERERVAVECYERQQQAQRELEALYTAMTERAQEAEAGCARLSRVAYRLKEGIATDEDMEVLSGDGAPLAAALEAWCEARMGLSAWGADLTDVELAKAHELRCAKALLAAWKGKRDGHS